MSKSMKPKLKPVSFVNKSTGTRWDDMLAKLVTFKNKHGHCNVPPNFEEDLSLGNWVNSQRSRKRLLMSIRLEKLSEIGFNWSFTQVGQPSKNTTASKPKSARKSVGVSCKIDSQITHR